MADRKKKRGKNEAPSNKLTKEEDAIARSIRFKCPTNTTMFEGNEVHYFSGKKAVDFLVNSKNYGAGAKNPKFATDVAAEDFLQSLLDRGLFFRAKKVVLKKKDKPPVAVSNEGDPKKGGVGKEESKPSPRPKKSKKDEVPAEKVDEEKKDNDDGEEESGVDKKAEPQEDEKKKKKKVKLIAHDVQVFRLDPSDVYVWIFDPTPFYKKVIGLLIVLGTIAGCLFPLWPDWLRLGIYYLSVTGIALFGVLLGIALARTIFFALIWLCTLGRHRLWVLPNLTEDCGFFESFKPFYTYEYVPGGAFSGEPANKKKKKTSTTDGEKANMAARQEARTEGDKPKKDVVKDKSEAEETKWPKGGKLPKIKKQKSQDFANSIEDEDEDENRPLLNDDSSSQDDEDENHPSDELSVDSTASEEERDGSGDEAAGPSARRRRHRKGKQHSSNTTPDDDFVIIDGKHPQGSGGSSS